MFVGRNVVAGAAIVLLMLVSGTAAFAAGEAGWVQEAKGTVNLISTGKTTPVKTGTAVRAQDRLKTGANSRVQVMFKDKTILALAADSECLIGDVYLEKPEKSLVALTLEFFKGTFDVLAGKAAKLHPERFQVKTPMVSLGVRGTEFASAVDGSNEVHGLYAGGPVVVTRLGVNKAKASASPPKVTTAQLCEQIEKSIDAAEKAYRDCRIARQSSQSKSWEAKVTEFENLAKKYNCN